MLRGLQFSLQNAEELIESNLATSELIYTYSIIMIMELTLLILQVNTNVQNIWLKLIEGLHMRYFIVIYEM